MAKACAAALPLEPPLSAITLSFLTRSNLFTDFFALA